MLLTDGFGTAGFSPAGRHARVPPRQVSGQLTNLQRARTCQGSLPDPDEVSSFAPQSHTCCCSVQEA